MLKISTIIVQLASLLPRFTDRFSTEFSITSLTQMAGTVTATTSLIHNLSVGDIVFIKGAIVPVTISSLTSALGIATAVTAEDHDLTVKGSDAVVSGADQSEYNGTFAILDAPNWTTFTYKVSGTPVTPATGAPILEDGSPFNGYNGQYVVTGIPDTTTFTYTTDYPRPQAAIGSPIVSTALRVSGSISLERAIEAYTRQGANKYWMFVVPTDAVASRSRNTETDAIDTTFTSTELFENFISTFSLYVFAPTTGTIAARQSYDDMMDTSLAIQKSILGAVLPVGVSDDFRNGVTLLSHAVVDYNTSYYIHQFAYQLQSIWRGEDGVPIGRNYPIRCINYIFKKPDDLDDETIIMSATATVGE